MPRGGFAELRRLSRELWKLEAGDILYLQRAIKNNYFNVLLVLFRLLRRNQLIFDFCDPIWLTTPNKARIFSKLADAVVVSGEDLALWVRAHSKNVRIIPNSIPRMTAIPNRTASKIPVMGWLGAAELHRDNLELLLDAFELLKTPVTFRLVGARGASDLIARFRQLSNIRFETVDWLPADQVRTELQTFDLALLPTQDIPWNRKLMTKLIEYMAAGLPVVASPVGENRRAITNGVNGFLATSPREWAEKIDRLADSAPLRDQMGKEAWETVRRSYSLENNGAQLAQLVRELASTP